MGQGLANPARSTIFLSGSTGAKSTNLRTARGSSILCARRSGGSSPRRRLRERDRGDLVARHLWRRRPARRRPGGGHFVEDPKDASAQAASKAALASSLPSLRCSVKIPGRGRRPRGVCRTQAVTMSGPGNNSSSAIAPSLVSSSGRLRGDTPPPACCGSQC